jgi:hypothetical protein
MKAYLFSNGLFPATNVTKNLYFRQYPTWNITAKGTTFQNRSYKRVYTLQTKMFLRIGIRL